MEFLFFILVLTRMADAKAKVCIIARFSSKAMLHLNQFGGVGVFKLYIFMKQWPQIVDVEWIKCSVIRNLFTDGISYIKIHFPTAELWTMKHPGSNTKEVEFADEESRLWLLWPVGEGQCWHRVRESGMAVGHHSDGDILSCTCWEEYEKYPLMSRDHMLVSLFCVSGLGCFCMGSRTIYWLVFL